MRIGPVVEVTTSFRYGKHGIEIRIWSVGQDNSQSWVRISYGTNKYVVDSNYNNAEVPADLPEEQASLSSVRVVAARSKAKAKPQKTETVELPNTIPMNERKWIDIEPEESSLSAYEVSKKVVNLLRHCQTIQREDDGAVQFWRIKFYHQNQFPHKYSIGLMSFGNLACQQEDVQKGDISIALIVLEQSFTSVLFRDTLGVRYRTM